MAFFRWFLPFGPTLTQTGGALASGAGGVGKAGSFAIARLASLMLEDYEKNGWKVEWNQQRVEATIAFSATINAALTLWTARNIAIRQPAAARQVLTLLVAADVADKAGEVTLAATHRAEARAAQRVAGSSISRILGRLFLVDTLIWAITGGIDLTLNLMGIPEEEQGIFADMYGGWSPVGELIGFGFTTAADLMGVEPEELAVDLLEAVLGEETAEAAIWAALAFYIKNISYDLQIDAYVMSRAINEGIHEAWIDSILETPTEELIYGFAEDVILLTVIAIIISQGFKLIGKMWTTSIGN